MTNIELHGIESSEENAKIVQQLRLEHYRVGNFPNPLRFANPASKLRVDLQRADLKNAPDDYTGLYIGDELAGLVKTEEWTADHEFSFTTNGQYERLRELQSIGIDIVGPEKLAITALSIDKERAGGSYKEGAERLLDIVTDKAAQRGKAAVYGAFYAGDPLSIVALNNGFQFTERQAMVPAYAGIPHQLYTKPLDY